MHNAVHIDWQPIKAKRASEDIYAQLRDLITSGALKPGDRLPSERAMMEQLQRSRPTIREALRMLEQGGYVASTHGASGAVVQELTIDGVEEPLAAMLQVNQISLEELGEYRESNDGTIAAWAAQRRTEDDLSALRDCLIQAEEALADTHRRAPAQVGQAEGVLAVAAIRDTEEGKQCRIALDGQQLALGRQPSPGAGAARGLACHGHERTYIRILGIGPGRCAGGQQCQACGQGRRTCEG